MSEFRLTYKVGNFEMELKGEEKDFIETFNRFENDYLPVLVKNINTNQIISNRTVVKKSDKKSKENKKNKENKNLNKDCKKVKLDITESQLKDWINFYNNNIGKTTKSYEKISLLLYWLKYNLKDSNIGKITQNTIYSFFFKTGNKVEFVIKDGLANAQREGNAYISRTKDEGDVLEPNGEDLVSNILNNV